MLRLHFVGEPRQGSLRGRVGSDLGNMLDDPGWSEHRISGYPEYETPTIEMHRTLQNWTQLGFVRYNNGTIYTAGGRVLRQNPGSNDQGGGAPILDADGNLQFAYTYWPGNFFYRGLYDIPVLRKGYTHHDPGANPGAENNRYLMGVYGSYATSGYDVIRLEARDFNGDRLWYHQPPPWEPNSVTHYSDIYVGYGDGPQEGAGLPEVAGGGNAFDGPWYPYDYPNGDFGDFVYGAPDGVPDGIILILHAGADAIRANTF